jgi:hypothetical protein
LALSVTDDEVTSGSGMTLTHCSIDSYLRLWLLTSES